MGSVVEQIPTCSLWRMPHWRGWLHLKKACFYKFINSKRRIRENLPPLLDAEENIVTKDEEKAEVLKPTLPQSLAVELAVPWTPSLMSWEMGRGSRMRSAQLKRRWSESCYTSYLGYTQGC